MFEWKDRFILKDDRKSIAKIGLRFNKGEIMEFSFVYNIPTHVYFGSLIGELGEQVKRYGRRAMIIYDGEHVKRSGLYDQITAQLENQSVEYIVFNGVRPNPRHTDIQQGVELCKANQIEVLIAVGGGSVIDSAKAIGAAFYYEGDCWEMICAEARPDRCLPIIAVSTISATGSEMDNGAVITNEETREKRVLASQSLYPAAAFLDPKLTYTVPKLQTACGVADILAHILEEYFTPSPGMMLIDSVMEGLIRTMLVYGPEAVEQPTNYEARANMMWSAAWAINGFVSLDRPHPWSMHPLGHQLSAYYDLTHGITLALIMPRWLKYIKDDESLPLFRKLGLYAFMLDPMLSSETMADEIIDRLEDLFYRRLGLPSTLSELNIGDEHFDEMAEQLCSEQGFLNGYRKLSKEDILAIYRQCL